MTTIKLQHPIAKQILDKHGRPQSEEIIAELTLRRATLADLETMQSASGTPLAQTRKLIALLSGLEDPIIRKMDAADFMEVSKVIEGFIGIGQPTTGG